MGKANGLQLACLVGALLGLMRPAVVAASSVAIDSTRSAVAFRLPLLLFGQVQGRFARIEGRLRSGAQGWRICARVPVQSAEMKHAADREELLGPQFFDAAAHPLLRYESHFADLDALAAGSTLQGTLQIRGVRRQTRLRIAALVCPADTPRPAGCHLSLAGSVRRTDFGMRARSGVLGRQVELRLDIQFQEGPEHGRTRDDVPCLGPD